MAPDERVVIQRNVATASGARPGGTVRVVREQFADPGAIADARSAREPRGRFDIR